MQCIHAIGEADKNNMIVRREDGKALENTLCGTFDVGLYTGGIDGVIVYDANGIPEDYTVQAVTGSFLLLH